MNRLLSGYTWVDSFALFFSCALVSYFMWFPITDADIFWHLASAKEMIRTESFLRVDPFSYTPIDPVWVNIHWLFQLMLYGLYSAFSMKAILYAKCIAMALGVFLMLVVHKGSGNVVIGGFVLVFSLFFIRYQVDARPIVITLVAISCYFYLLYGYIRTHQLVYLVFLIPIMILWVNCQGLYVLGLFIVLCFLLEQCIASVHEKKLRTSVVHLLIVIGALFAACCVNPSGIAGAAYAVRIFKRIDPSLKNIFSENVSENMPLLKVFATDPALVCFMFCLALLYLVSILLKGRCVSLAEKMVVAAFFGLALMAQRNCVLFVWVAAPGIAASLSAFLRSTSFASAHRKPIAFWGICIFVIVMVVPVQLHALMLFMVPKTRTIAPFRFPKQAVDFMKSHPFPGKVFNTDRYGGYVLWELFPPVQNFIDGRFIMRSPEFFANYLTILDNPTVFEDVCQKFGIKTALIQTAYFPRYLPLAKHLYVSGKWNLVFTDGSSCLFYKKSDTQIPGLSLSDISTVDSLAHAAQNEWPEKSHLRKEAKNHVFALVQYFQ